MLISQEYLKEKGLTPKQIGVFLLRYNGDGMVIRTLEEVGQCLGGLSKERIHQLEKRALPKLPKIVQRQLVGDLKPPALESLEMIEWRFSGGGLSYRELAKHFPLTDISIRSRVCEGIRRIAAREKAGVLTEREKAIIRRAKEHARASSIIEANKVLKPLLQSRTAKERYKQKGPTDVEKFAKAAEVSTRWVYWAIDELVERGVLPPERKRKGSGGEARIVLSDKMVEALWQFRKEKRGKSGRCRKKR